MSTELLVATSNAGKVREIRRVLAGLPLDVVTLGDFDPVPEPEENGRTFAENARSKALYYATALSRLAVGEDSGLEIDALGGAPGVYSARFGLPGAPAYPDKFALIYQMLLQRVGRVDSSARFVCSLALAAPEREGAAPEILFEACGTVDGRIVQPPRGEGGFGYDPIFFYPPFGQTLAEVPPGRKEEVSHRGKAFRELREYLLKDGKNVVGG